jgi:hypothetical protein
MITPKELTPARAEQIYIGHAAWRGPVADMLADALAGWQFERNRREAEIADAAKIVDALVAIHNAALRDLRSVRALVDSERANADQCLAELNAMGEQLTAAERERNELANKLETRETQIAALQEFSQREAAGWDAAGTTLTRQREEARAEVKSLSAMVADHVRDTLLKKAQRVIAGRRCPSCGRSKRHAHPAHVEACADGFHNTPDVFADTNTSEAGTSPGVRPSAGGGSEEPAPTCPRCDALVEALRALVCYCEGPVTIASFGGNLDRAKKAIAAHGGGK